METKIKRLMRNAMCMAGSKNGWIWTFNQQQNYVDLYSIPDWHSQPAISTCMHYMLADYSSHDVLAANVPIFSGLHHDVGSNYIT